MSLEIITSNVDLSLKEVQDIVDKFKINFGTNIDLSTLIEATIELMKIVGQLKKLKGHEKKYLVTKILIYIVNESNIEEYNEIVDKILISVIPIMIDNLVSVEKGELKFNKNAYKNCLLCTKH